MIRIWLIFILLMYILLSHFTPKEPIMTLKDTITTLEKLHEDLLGERSDCHTDMECEMITDALDDLAMSILKLKSIQIVRVRT